MSSWRQVHPDVFLRRDSCNVYAVRGVGDAWIVVNAGTGASAANLAELGRVGEVTLLLTHHFRDHAAGAPCFRAAGARVAAPWHERDHLTGAQPAMRGKQTLFLYDLSWDHFAPIVPLAVDLWLHDYQRLELGGLAVEVVATPGVTMGASSFVITLAGGAEVAFVGELMAGPGRLSRLSPLQYNYNDLTGLENVLLSWRRVLESGAEFALPSLGEPFARLEEAGERLRREAARFESVQPGFAARLAAQTGGGVEEVVPRLYRATHASAETHFVVSRAGKVLALDFGYDAAGVRFPARLASWTRRPLLHSWPDLRRRTGAERIDVVLPTHYHDDHVVGVPLLQRLFGTELWAAENFADLLERPTDFDRPCLWPEPMRVARRLPLGRRFEWEDVAITLHPMSGHTEFSALILLEIDGQRVAHTGDQLFFVDPASGQLVGPDRGGVFTNHVYRNGLALGCYREFLERLRSFDPHVVLSGHHRPYRPDPALWERIAAAARTFDEVHRSLLGLGDDDVHCGADSSAAKLIPYLVDLTGGRRRAVLGGWVRNPLGRDAVARLRLVCARPGWRVSALELPLPPRARTGFELTLEVPAGEPPGREPVALDLEVDGRPFGSVTEAWVTVG